MRIGAYTRLSEDRYGTATACERQLHDAEAYAARVGGEICATYRDNDLSGWKRDLVRPDLDRLLDDIEHRAIDVLLVWKFDRLTRQSRQLEPILDACDDYGVELRSVTEPVDTSTRFGKMGVRQAVMYAQYESDVKSDRALSKHQELVRLGLSNGGARCFGYEKGHRALCESEAGLVRDAAQRVLEGESLSSIARDWGKAGVVGTTGKPWRAAHLGRLLRNPRLIGQRVYKGTTVGEAVWPAILSPSVFESVGRVLAETPRASKSTKPKHWLTGMLTCSKCGARMGARANFKRPAYGCLRQRGGCNGTFIATAWLEPLVAEMLFAYLDGPALAGVLASGDEGGPLVDFSREEELLARIDHKVSVGEISTERWEKMSTEIQGRLDAARAALVSRSAVAAYTGRGDELRESWPTLSLERRRAVLGACVETITILPGRPGVHGPQPERVVPVWRQGE